MTPRPPYDPDLNAVLATFPEAPLLSTESLPIWRSFALGFDSIREAIESHDVVYEERTATGIDGNEILLSIIRPARVSSDASAVYAIHGGGMVAGDRFTGIIEYDMIGWVERFGIVLISPEYRLAPDSPAPAGVEDCYSGLVWVADNATDLGIDPARIVVGGVSGGGGLAAGAALLARDRQGPDLLAQLLICPQLDDRNDTPSALQYVDADGVRAIWPLENNVYAWRSLLGAGHVDRADIPGYVSPARAKDLAGLPPAYIDAGSAEVFRDEAVSYASRLWAAGVQAELHVWAGGFHGFDIVAPGVPVSAASREVRESWLRRTC